ncbi:MAG: hypothetical protein ABH815_03380 [Candidatus Omnitrophota bacterium]
MKKIPRITLLILIGLMVLCFTANASYAGKASHSIPVSCSIPEIPGLNAPLVEEQTYRDVNILEEAEEGTKEEDSSLKPQLVQQETRHNLYTFYVR